MPGMVPKDKQAILDEFRQGLLNEGLIHDGDTIGTDDETLLRFLRARNFNLKQSTLMWKNCQHWRSTVEGVGIDELYRQIDPFDYPERELVFDCWPLYFHKTDKEGHPLNFHHFGGINLDKLQKQMSLKRFWQTVIVNCEALPREVLPAASEAAGKPINGTFVVVDLSGFGISQFWQVKDFSRSSFQVSQDYFPETVARLAIVNAPRGFSTIWNVMKPWIAKETASKVTIHGSDYKSKLLELIDEEALPEKLGGKCTCTEHGGCMKSNAGPWMHNREQRREAWLNGERPTIAILPGELSSDVLLHAPAEKSSGAEVEPEQQKCEAESSASTDPASTSVSASTSETSSEEDEPIATPPVSEGDLAGQRSISNEALEKSLGRINVQDVREEAQTRQVEIAAV
ncbi:CRAL/TRIO domain-containing protein [Lentinus brumalis]|uniref:CRAL/TRIO domain-containing protein n=1 Tax=Lentinus brumalis TaxID=2498619 RepID=A0A371DL89_9APHY|nr:CRAL/TRIO domain-containing protein [Polyporus brumalis]